MYVLENWKMSLVINLKINTICWIFFESNIYQNIIVVVTPLDKSEFETAIRDVKDRPILRAALARNVDLFLTGDKDFLESGLIHPLIISPRDFLDNY